MITNQGKQHIRRVLVNQQPTVASAMVFGIGQDAVSLDDKDLNFEVARVPVDLRAVDEATGRIIFKSRIPNELIGQITEVGLISSYGDSNTDNSSIMISTIDDLSEDWQASEGTVGFSDSNNRIGDSNLVLGTGAGTTAVATMPIALDLSPLSSQDALRLAVFQSGSLTGLTVQFHTTADDYLTGAFSVDSGYSILSLPKGSFVSVGTPRWDSISSVKVIAESSSPNSNVVELDAFGFFDQDFTGTDGVLVARTLVSPTLDKNTPAEVSVEFALEVTI